MITDEMPKLTCVSRIGADGTQYCIVTIENPKLDSNNLWVGGKCLDFELNHKKQTTDLYRSPMTMQKTLLIYIGHPVKLKNISGMLKD